MFWWDCCKADCLNPIVEDKFDRANSTDLGALWDERTPDWSIDTQRLKEAGNADALVICTTEHPKRAVSCGVAITTKSEQVGDTYRIIVNYVDDNNYHYADLLIGATDVTITLYEYAAGGSTQLVTKTTAGKTGDTRTFSVCFTDQVFSASVSDPPPTACTTWTTNITAHSGGIQVGLGNGGATAIYMDDFWFSEHYLTHPDCPRCHCHCQALIIPKVLTATFSGTGQLTCADGATITLTWRDSDGNWYGTGTVCGTVWELLLLCAEAATDGLATDFRLQVSSTPSCCDADPSSCDRLASAGSTCSPIDFVFGPFGVPWGDLSCACCARIPMVMDSTYTWTVTE